MPFKSNPARSITFYIYYYYYLFFENLRVQGVICLWVKGFATFNGINENTYFSAPTPQKNYLKNGFTLPDLCSVKAPYGFILTFISRGISQYMYVYIFFRSVLK